MKDGFYDFGEVYLLSNQEQEKYPLPSDVQYEFYSRESLYNSGYGASENMDIREERFYASLWFYHNHRYHKHYWFADPQIGFTGYWDSFFETMLIAECDFLSSHITKYEDDKDWPYWNELQLTDVQIDIEQRAYSMNPIYRISNMGIEFIEDFIKRGNRGTPELLIATVMFRYHFHIVDLGGDGVFTPRDYKERFYLSGIVFHDEYGSGTIRSYPEFDKIKSYGIWNRLFYPVKYEMKTKLKENSPPQINQKPRISCLFQIGKLWDFKKFLIFTNLWRK